MNNNINRSFTLNNCLAAVSAIPCGEYTYATDGHNCCIHIIKNDCCDECCQPTLRPYQKLRLNSDAGQRTALGQCTGRRIYLLSDNFCETGYIDLSLSRNSSCGCGGTNGELVDASLVCIGSEVFIVGAFANGAFLFDSGGKRLTRLCSTEDGETLTDFISLGNDVYAISTLCGRTQTITVSDNGNIHSAILQGCFTLRMLIPDGNEIYGLFGQNYIYNRIYKIYSNGILTLPRNDFICGCDRSY